MPTSGSRPWRLNLRVKDLSTGGKSGITCLEIAWSASYHRIKSQLSPGILISSGRNGHSGCHISCGACGCLSRRESHPHDPQRGQLVPVYDVDSICPVGRPVAEAACAFDGRMGALRAMTDKYHEHLWWNDFPRYGKRAFKEHNDLVRRVVPPERLLEYEVRQGWEPLCAFLGKDVPTGKEFPRVNDTQTFQQKSTHFIKKRYMAVLSNAAKTALPVLMVGAAMWWRFGGKTGLSRG